jgi:hypothetical protein
MWIEEMRWDAAHGWCGRAAQPKSPAGLVLYFGNRNALRDKERYAELRAAYPAAHIVGCSATCSIANDALHEEGIVAVALGFTRTPIRIAQHRVTELAGSRAAGEALGNALAAPDLAGVFVLADGLRVDGSSFVAGLSAAIGAGPLIVGGMASDARDYAEVLVGADCVPRSGMTVAVGFYGAAIRFASGTASGWDAFGPRRRITRSSGNVLYGLDDKPPIELYRRYLGTEISADARWGGVIFPLAIWPPEHPGRILVRAPLAVDDGPHSMTFAGHMPEGWIARLMRGNADRLILGAGDAARQARVAQPRPGAGDRLAFIVSCAGRNQAMGQRTEEELEVVGAELGGVKRIGFYSYGEIAPAAHSGLAELHNQTMIVTSLFEAEF